MNVYYNSHHKKHNPPNEIFNGNRDMHQEVPERVDQILRALENTNHIITDIRPEATETKALTSTLSKIHKREYVEYLQQTDFGGEYVYPSVFPYRNETYFSDHPVAARGYYSFDTYTPLSDTTYAAALESAFLAQKSASEVLVTGETSYALCRPPGHHAEPARMGGYCYFNNGGVAAQTLLDADPKNRVTILDVDFHHGNGAEKIFAETEKVLTISIHADPNQKFPFFSGQQTDEYVANINYPMPLGSGNDEYEKVLQFALQKIRENQTTHLVVCFGADTHESDPIGGFKLTTDFYTKMARHINGLGIPMIIVQEGGYNTSVLGDNVVAFLEGFNQTL